MSLLGPLNWVTSLFKHEFLPGTVARGSGAGWCEGGDSSHSQLLHPLQQQEEQQSWLSWTWAPLLVLTSKPFISFSFHSSLFISMREDTSSLSYTNQIFFLPLLSGSPEPALSARQHATPPEGSSAFQSANLTTSFHRHQMLFQAHEILRNQGRDG